jgi:hypothetical protein
MCRIWDVGFKVRRAGDWGWSRVGSDNPQQIIYTAIQIKMTDLQPTESSSVHTTWSLILLLTVELP